MTQRRYYASDDVEHGCCYGATVRDREDDDAVVAECHDERMARRIARLLNAEVASGWIEDDMAPEGVKRGTLIMHQAVHATGAISDEE